MAKRTVHFYLIKLSRLSAWLLMAVVISSILTGLTLTGEYGLARLISTDRALALHKTLVWPLIVLFGLHSVISIYFTFRRWGWIKTRARSKP